MNILNKKVTKTFLKDHLFFSNFHFHNIYKNHQLPIPITLNYNLFLQTHKDISLDINLILFLVNTTFNDLNN